jgi:hypothetical protein
MNIQPDRGGISVFQSSISDQPPRQVNGIVSRRGILEGRKGEWQMLAYFDTNVYSLIAGSGQADSLRAWLDDNGVTVIASMDNLTETWATPVESTMQLQLQAITTVASCYEKSPQPYLHAKEVLLELQRFRPSWLKPRPQTRSIARYLRTHTCHWYRAKGGRLPGPESRAAYQELFSRGAERALHVQRAAKSVRDDEVVTLGAAGDFGLEPIAEVDITDAEQAWRICCLTAWHAAIVERQQSSRDYLDYLGPYLKKEAFRDMKDAASFWLTEVDGARTRLNRAVGLAQHFQVSRRLQASNAGDVIHAAYLLEAEVLVTADRRFELVLKDVARVIGPCARIEYVRREQGLAALKEAIGGGCV